MEHINTLGVINFVNDTMEITEKHYIYFMLICLSLLLALQTSDKNDN